MLWLGRGGMLRGRRRMKHNPARQLYVMYVSVAIAAPLVMFIYLQLDLVCAPRAIVSETVCGVLALAFLTPAALRGSRPRGSASTREVHSTRSSGCSSCFPSRRAGQRFGWRSAC